MKSNFEFTTSLQYQVKALRKIVNDFTSGERYVQLKNYYCRCLEIKNSEIRKLKLELAQANASLVTMRKNWTQVCEDLEKEFYKKLQGKEKEFKKLQKELLRVQKENIDYKDKNKELRIALYEEKTKNEDAQGTISKLTAQINRDFENSSISSSMKVVYKKIKNSREKTDRKPGAQPGHKSQPRKKYTPTEVILVPAPEEYLDITKYKPTGRMISKQHVGIIIQPSIIEYQTPEYRKLDTNSRVHAKFPCGLIQDVTYDESVKAFCFMLNTVGNMSIEKVQEFISGVTGGILKPSVGMINSLTRKFSHKTEEERAEAIKDLLVSPVMNIDFTSTKINGKMEQIFVCATTKNIMYMHREKKGHEGIIGSPVEHYQGILVHDHDTTFYKYGLLHQECLAHILRYLKDSIENEPHLTWNTSMHKLLQTMIHTRNEVDANENIEASVVQTLEEEYSKILETARNEYEYEPASPYYIDGYNLYKRMDKYHDAHLLFLHNKYVPPTNNLSERLLRNLKRKQKQVMSFRSRDSVIYLCDSMSVIASLRLNNENIYQKVVECFA